MQGPPTIETARLVLRAPRAADIDALHAIQGDAAAMRHSWCAPDREATVRHVDGYASRFEQDGFAPWTALERDRGRVVGWGGLAREPGDPAGASACVSYFIHPELRGRGLATELVAASLRYAFEDLVLPAVAALVQPDNAASLRVLAKCGFVRVGDDPALDCEIHRIRRGEWLARRGAS